MSLYIIFQYSCIIIFFAKLAFNVLGIRRFGQAIGLCEANVPCPNCGGEKTAQRAKPDCGFSEPEPPLWAAMRIPCVMRWFCSFLFFYFYIDFILKSQNLNVAQSKNVINPILLYSNQDIS